MWNLFYRNRRLLILTVGVIVVAGLASYQVLPRREDPELTDRFASVKTIFPGADAERVEALVTEKLEEEIRENRGTQADRVQVARRVFRHHPGTA